jgi:N utilization substance protein B
MLSRRHIRIKVMQALYMYYNDGQGNLSTPQLNRLLEKNINRLYELYLYLLLFLEEMGQFVLHYDEEVKSRYVQQNEKDTRSGLKLYNNSIIQKLLKSEMFHKTLERYHVAWNADKDILRRIFLDLKNQDIYKEFLQFSEANPVLEQEVLLFLLKHYTANHPVFAQHLEEEFYNWLDDKKIVLQMAAKTVQSLAAGKADDESFLVPLSYNDDDNYEFARELTKSTIEQDAKLDEIISNRISKWEPHQVAVIDNIILKMAVSEFLNFPSIPVKVTINEYIELAKNYSTPQSKKFINGVLDAIVKDLKKEGTVVKG